MDGAPPLSAADELAALLGAVARIEIAFGEDDAETRAAAHAYRDAIDALNRAALRRLIAAVGAEPAARPALRAAAADPVVYAVLRHHGLVKPSIGERVEAAIETIRPTLAEHGGDVELVAVAPPRVEVRFTGACTSCPASVVTFEAGVKKAVQEACPEITEIVQAASAGLVR